MANSACLSSSPTGVIVGFFALHLIFGLFCPRGSRGDFVTSLPLDGLAGGCHFKRGDDWEGAWPCVAMRGLCGCKARDALRSLSERRFPRSKRTR